MSLLVSLFALGCGASKRRTPNDTLVVLIESATNSVDPRFAISNHDDKLSRLVCPGLMTVDQQSLEPKLALAESVEQIRPLLFEFKIRGDATFSSGAPVTAADVAYTFESVLDEKTKSPYRKGFMERFKRIEVVDEKLVRFHLAKPVATLFSDLDFGVIQKGSDSAAPIGAGPYRVVKWDPERTLLAANKHYFGPTPKTEKIEVRTVRDQNARSLMLAGGSADIVQNAIRLDLVGRVAARDSLKLQSGPGAILTYFMMHNEDPVLRDIRVRRAIAHAIDRERIVEQKLDGHAVLATGLLQPSHWAYHGDVAKYPYDPERARQLLDEAGYPDPDGPGGKPRLTLSYKTSANQFRLALARIIASQLREVGIEIEVRSFEFGTFFTDIKQGNYQLASMQTAPITEPDYLFSYFHSSRIPTKAYKNAGNRWRYRNFMVDVATEAGRAAMSREARVRHYQIAQAQLARDLPVIPLWHEDVVAVVGASIDDYFVLPSARLPGLATAHKK